MRESLTEPMYTVVVQGMGDSITDVVGPFYDEMSAEYWAKRNVARVALRYSIRRLTERGLWEAEHRHHA